MSTPLSAAEAAEPESLAELIGDCHKMAAHWEVHAKAAPPEAVSLASLHGIHVPAASVRAVDGMAEYGD